MWNSNFDRSWKIWYTESCLDNQVIYCEKDIFLLKPMSVHANLHLTRAAHIVNKNNELCQCNLSYCVAEMTLLHFCAFRMAILRSIVYSII